MTLELVDLNRVPGYAGALRAVRHPDLANRYHFWRGASGRRYACTRFPVSRVPVYDGAISLFVRRRGGETIVIGISATTNRQVAPLGTDEVHLHLVQDGAEAVEAALADLSALVLRRVPLYVVERRAA